MTRLATHAAAAAAGALAALALFVVAALVGRWAR
jgi:hypothetical protein